jgi:hypothetical protein
MNGQERYSVFENKIKKERKTSPVVENRQVGNQEACLGG